MRILHISTSDIAGGAARAAHRVHSGLLRLGHESRMLVLKKWSVDSAVTKFTPGDRLMDRIRRRFRRQRIQTEFAPHKLKRPPGSEQFSDDRTEWRDEPLRDLPEYDIINFHWVAGFVDYVPWFQWLAKHRPQTPLVWRMADMAPLTGGCHYDQGCGKFAAMCGACPVLNSTDENDLSRDVWTRKNEALRSMPPQRLHLVATSRWIGEQAAKSSLLSRFAQTIIPNALDTDVFQPRDKMFSRDVLNIPRQSKAVLFAADNVKHRRKGFAELAQAVEGIGGIDNLTLISIGGSQPQITGGQRLIHLGKIDDDRVLSMAYSAADLFVIPSLQESFGQTVIEAMACGTPTVGFASGGITDTVRPGITGALAPTGDVPALRDAIARLLRDSAACGAMAITCRQTAIAEYALDVQARQYDALYRSLIASRS
jgi:glycosyltransferase involved in cell wall biosynthesis